VIPEGVKGFTSNDPEKPPKTPTAPGEVHALGNSEAAGSPAETKHGDRNPHAWIGVSLILGFILMYLIDTLPSLKPPPVPQRAGIYSLSELGSAPQSPPLSSGTPKRSFSTTLGLVIHSAADGIALGASSTQPSLSFIIFLAIMIHKAPAAFGLTSVLLKQGLSKKQARAHLVAFSLAAPIGATCTWIALSVLGGGEGGSEETMKWWTGVLVLFSGGTFLYVAMHIMQEDDHGDHSEEPQSAGYLGLHHPRTTELQKPKKSLGLVSAAVVGMLLPLITQIGHAH